MAKSVGKPCGNSYISAHKNCNVGVSLRSGEGVLDVVGKAKKRGIKADQIKKLADAVRDKYGLKQIRGEALNSFHRRVNELLDGGSTPKAAVEKAAKEASAKEKAKSNDKPNSLDAWGVDQLKDRLKAARELGFDDKAADIEKAILRKVKDNPEELRKFKDEQDLADIDAAVKKAVKDKVSTENLQKLVARRAEAEARVKRAQGVPLTNEIPEDMTKYTLNRMRDIDKKVESNTTESRGGAYDWGSSLSGSAKQLGEGAFGTAVFDGKNVVKRGDLGPDEAKLIEKVGGLGLGPKLVSAQVDGEGVNRGTKMGRVAMSKVEGSPIGRRSGLKVQNAYWTARAALHRAGIAHNDMHIENVFMDRKGNGRFVDLGMAQDNPKAALAEALGVFGRGDRGDWQVRRWRNIGGGDLNNAARSTSDAVKREFASRFPTAAKVLANKEKAILRMKQFGLSDQDIDSVVNHGIRSKDSSFERGAMGKLTNVQALEVINTLYEGI